MGIPKVFNNMMFTVLHHSHHIVSPNSHPGCRGVSHGLYLLLILPVLFLKLIAGGSPENIFFLISPNCLIKLIFLSCTLTVFGICTFTCSHWKNEVSSHTMVVGGVKGGTLTMAASSNTHIFTPVYRRLRPEAAGQI